METKVLSNEKRASRTGREKLALAELLQAELARRCRENPRYSLRSFAAHLGLSPSFLSKLLTGKRPFTLTTLRKVSRALALTPSEMKSFEGQIAGGQEIEFQPIALDQFQFIADWYHFAILELVTLRQFREDPKWIGAQLGISPHQARDALDRLVRLDYLTYRGDHLALTRENNSTIGPEVAVPATHTQQSQFLELALRALRDVPIEHRSQTGITMAIPASRLGEAREMIKDFRRKFMREMQRPGARDAVYQLSVSFFPLTPNSKETP